MHTRRTLSQIGNMELNCCTLLCGIEEGLVVRRPWIRREMNDESVHQVRLRHLLRNGDEELFPGWEPWRFMTDFESCAGSAFYRIYRSEDVIAIGAVAWSPSGAASAWEAMNDLFVELIEPLQVPFVRKDVPPLPWHCSTILPAAAVALPWGSFDVLGWHEIELANAMIRRTKHQATVTGKKTRCKPAAKSHFSHSHPLS